MSIKRGSVLAVIGLCLVLVGTIEAQAQGNRGNTTTRPQLELDGGGLSALRTFVNALVVQVEQSKQKIAQLEAALNAEISARQAADVVASEQHQRHLGWRGNPGVCRLEAARSPSEAAGPGGSRRGRKQPAFDRRCSPRGADCQRGCSPRGCRRDVRAAELGDVALAALVPLAAHVTVAAGDINGLAGPHVIFSGANVHVRSGSLGDSLLANGRGNLIVGYNESGGYVPEERGGSHNVVVGAGHRYNFGDGIGGRVRKPSRRRWLRASAAAFINDAAANSSSVSGGSNNRATGMFATRVRRRQQHRERRAARR